MDGFQGREKEAVIISLTRSNDKGKTHTHTHYRHVYIHYNIFAHRYHDTIVICTNFLDNVTACRS